MKDHPFLRAIYAAARRALDKAREHQDLALEFALMVYMPGYRGREARRLRKLHHAEREARLGEALRMRANASRLRAELRALERAKTDPPTRAA